MRGYMATKDISNSVPIHDVEVEIFDRISKTNLNQLEESSGDHQSHQNVSSSDTEYLLKMSWQLIEQMLGSFSLNQSNLPDQPTLPSLELLSTCEIIILNNTMRPWRSKVDLSINCLLIYDKKQTNWSIDLSKNQAACVSRALKKNITLILPLNSLDQAKLSLLHNNHILH